jgi:hypothetical protein
VVESAATPEARHQILMSAGQSMVIPHDVSLYTEKGGFDRRRSAYAPEQRCQTQHQFALDRRLGVIVSDDRRLESLVVLDVLKRSDDGFGA